MRSLLDTREHCLEEFHFVDPYAQQKRDENEQALQLLAGRLAELDGLEWAERQLALARGLLAGNVFDWGAKAVASLMDAQRFGFEEATDKLQGEVLKGNGIIAWMYAQMNSRGHDDYIQADLLSITVNSSWQSGSM